MTTTTTQRSASRRAAPSRPRLRRGRSISLDNGLRHDHDVTCTLAGTPEGCDCPYSFWRPRTSPRRRVRVTGTMHEALRLRDRMQREASGTIDLTTYAPAHALTAPVALPAQASVDLPANVSMTPLAHRTPTFHEWAQQVMETIWLRHSPSTRQTRTSTYRLYVRPDLGPLDLAAVTAPVVEAWLADLSRREVSLHMQRHAYDLVRTITKHWYELTNQPNPVAVVKRPITPPSTEKRAKDCTITAAQYQHVLAACNSTAEELMIRVATEAGLRIGEIAGLQRRDVFVKARTITVKRQGNRNTTKTGQVRIVTMVNDDLVRVFERHLTDMADAGFDQPDTYIWRGGHSYEESVNKPYERQGIYRIIKRVLARAGLADATRPHGLRATGAKLLIEAGASMELVSQHLGHATLRTTEEYYVGQVKTSGLASYGKAFG